jgi:SAM-dependent methyltransferase
VIGYDDPEKYWDHRWRYKLIVDSSDYDGILFLDTIKEIMAENNCYNILEVGCGRAVLRHLPHYTGLDFSLEVLEQSKLEHYIHADITEVIPLPDKSQDAILSRLCLIHIPYSKINKAISEMIRVTNKVVILQEYPIDETKRSQPHTFNHNYVELFENNGYEGKIIFLDYDLHKFTVELQKVGK